MDTAVPGILIIGGVMIFVGLFIASAFLLWGAKIAGIENRSFGKAFAAVILGGIAGFVLSLVLSSIPAVGAGLAMLGGFLAEALVIMPIFQTTFGKALGASVLSWILTLVVMAALAVVIALLVGGLATVA